MPIGIHTDTRNTYLNVTYADIASCINNIVRGSVFEGEIFHLVYCIAKDSLLKLNIEPTETKITDEMFNIFENIIKNSRIS